MGIGLIFLPFTKRKMSYMSIFKKKKTLYMICFRKKKFREVVCTASIFLIWMCFHISSQKYPTCFLLLQNTDCIYPYEQLMTIYTAYIQGILNATILGLNDISSKEKYTSNFSTLVTHVCLCDFITQLYSWVTRCII